MGAENIRVDVKQMEKVVKLVLESRKDEASPIFEGKVKLPEEEFVRLVTKYGEETNNPAFGVTAVFLATMFDFGGRSKVLFDKIANVELLAKCAWLFEPKVVVEKEAGEVEQACREFFGPAGGYNIANSAPEYWHNCQVIVEKYGGDIRNFFESCDYDAVKVVEGLDTKSRKRGKMGFRRYGPKLGPMVVERLTRWGLCKLKNTELIDVPVDRHKARISLRCFALVLSGEVNAHWVTGVAREELKKVCKKKKWLPNEVSEAMYILGSRLCAEALHGECPLKRECKIRLAIEVEGGKYRQVQDYFGDGVE
jgi:hypothetical protein